MELRKLRTLALMAIAILVALFASACGGSTAAEQELVSTEWEVSGMEGFPEENPVEGTFSFTEDRFRFNDGVNSVSLDIEWTDDGFVIEGGGDSTVVATDGAEPNLRLFATTGASIQTELEGDSLSMISGSRKVIANTSS